MTGWWSRPWWSPSNFLPSGRWAEWCFHQDILFLHWWLGLRTGWEGQGFLHTQTKAQNSNDEAQDEILWDDLLKYRVFILVEIMCFLLWNMKFVLFATILLMLKITTQSDTKTSYSVPLSVNKESYNNCLTDWWKQSWREEKQFW